MHQTKPDDYIDYYDKPIKKQNSFGNHFDCIAESINFAIRDLNKMVATGEKPMTEDQYPSEYANPFHQACYITRYLYAFAYEYYWLFKEMFEQMEKDRDIKVVSLGCGAMIDAWSLQEAALDANIKGQIDYIGVDTVEWEKKYIPNTTAKIKKAFLKGRAGEYLNRINGFDFDILIFPKSITDIRMSDNLDYKKILNALSYKHIKENEFFIAMSLVKSESMELENKFSKEKIVCCIQTRKGYKCYSGKNDSISNSNPGFPRLGMDISEWSKELTGRYYMNSRQYENYEVFKLVRG